MYSDLNEIVRIIEKLEQTSSTKAKEYILKTNKDNELLQKVLFYCYDPNKKYGVSERFLNGLEFDANDCSSDNLFNLLDTLAANNINDALRTRVRRYINYFPDPGIRELIKRILGKNMKCNINVKLINKVWEDLIPTSAGERKVVCQLGSKVDLDKIPQDEVKFVTEKYDGCRAWIFIENGKVEMYSRQGKLYENCKEIEEDLLKLGVDNVLLDGEILATNCSYENVYKETTKRLKNKKPIKTGLYLMLYDYIELDEYKNLKGKYKYSERRKKLDLIKPQQFVKIAPVLLITTDMNEILKVLDEYRNKGAEGLMINLDRPYEFKRTKALIKLKVFEDADVLVTNIVEGEGRLEGTLGKIEVQFKYEGKIYTNYVGSGFSDNERDYFWNHKDELIGKIITIKYFELSKNKKGGIGFRFGTWQGREYIRIDKEGIDDTNV